MILTLEAAFPLSSPSAHSVVCCHFFLGGGGCHLYLSSEFAFGSLTPVVSFVFFLVGRVV